MTKYSIMIFVRTSRVFKFIVLCLCDELKNWDHEIYLLPL